MARCGLSCKFCDIEKSVDESRFVNHKSFVPALADAKADGRNCCQVQ